MNIEQARKLSIPDLLAACGHQPIKITKGNTSFLYLSPFRKEEKPSFYVDYKGALWLWHDFPSGGGDIIKLASCLNNDCSTQDALKFIEDKLGGNNRTQQKFSFSPQSDFKSGLSHKSTLVLHRVESLGNDPHSQIIRAYLSEERKIAKNLVSLYLHKIHYWNRNKPKTKLKPYFAFGIKNRLGGYEIRSASSGSNFKSSLNGKAISIIQGGEDKTQTINIFEGMLDFLSLLTLLKIENLKGDSIILHSTTAIDQAIEFITSKKYQFINSFLDNDESGETANSILSSQYGTKFKNQSIIFHPFKDINELLMEGGTLRLN